MNNTFVSEDVEYLGVFDDDLDLFEGQYTIPAGISYNSYLIKDEKIAVMDSVDKRKTKEWLENLEKALNGKKPDYLVVSHVEPDHSASISAFLEKYPDTAIVGNAKTFTFLNQFFRTEKRENDVLVAEGTKLPLGKHTLNFTMAPMVHWPEVMMTFEESEGLLFSADAFGKFGGMDLGNDWDEEAGRYYINIVGKYGMQVQAVLKKAANLAIKTICPLHGPVLKEDLGHYLDLYNTWSSYKPAVDGTVIAYCSIYGNTEKAALLLRDKLIENGKEAVAYDLSRVDVSYPVYASFKYSNLVIASPTYDGMLFPPCEDFLHHLKGKNFQNRKVAIIENGTWGPIAGKLINDRLTGLKNLDIISPVITIKSSMSDKNIEEITELAKNF